MAYVGKFAPDGSWNVTVVDGLTYAGYYAADGSVNVTGTVVGTPSGAMSSAGCLNVRVTSDVNYVGHQTPEGGLWVDSADLKNGSQRITFVSGSL